MKIEILTPYTTWPRMQKNTGPIFKSTPALEYKVQKLKEINKFGDDLWAIDNNLNTLELIKKASKFCGLNELDNIVDLALCLEEDIAIIHNAKLAAICFCFPSSWIPRERIGLSLDQIHAPVADNEKLISVGKKLADTIASPVLGSFRRTVWTITNNPELSNHPKNKLNSIPACMDDLYFRLETQTTAPLGDGLTSLFFVDVKVYPLSIVWKEHSKEIVSSINSMSEAILEYKNLTYIKELLNNFTITRYSEPQIA